ncbi:hypothetical protein FOYG_14081 [Fusarium oxysporum NRRL 32931]|uniref:Uncharacterized protein n=1 Tax=Fusarium oxysporum NRRL 32931 TaxID=660029 RepID=W9HU25_FUSOX|nr:hypothetical protein FOYG_14081 [Fusarium oxysporum NRRL 32931]
MVGMGLYGRNAAYFAFLVYRPRWKCGKWKCAAFLVYMLD